MIFFIQIGERLCLGSRGAQELQAGGAGVGEERDGWEEVAGQSAARSDTVGLEHAERVLDILQSQGSRGTSCL
jgi:hypothetical protein